jgi:mRNA interferase RelE/StbE
MARYKIFISKTAQKALDKLPDSAAESLIQEIARLGDNPRPFGYKKLKGRNGFRIRKGNYRIIYEIIDRILTIDIIAIGDRKDIYD